jgi:hypothetical protein
MIIVLQKRYLPVHAIAQKLLRQGIPVDEAGMEYKLDRMNKNSVTDCVYA